MKESIHQLAKKEYGTEVEVKENGKTIGVRLQVKGLLSELVASDQWVWKKMEDLMMVLSRTALSCDNPPDFVVLDVMDQDDPRVHIIFTRYVRDIQMIMADALSRNQFLDRLLIEFVIGDKKTVFDVNDTDIVRLLMMSADLEVDLNPHALDFHLDDVDFRDFLAKVAAKTMQRTLRDQKDLSNNFLLREVTGNFNEAVNKNGQFKILIDLVSKPTMPFASQILETKILPYVAKEVGEVFRSYKFDSFTNITVVEKNSGKLLTVSKR